MEDWIAETACAVFEGNKDDVADTIQLMNDMTVKKKITLRTFFEC